ncbi:MAG: Flp pilus assembly protein CpaB [Peptococcaceae bacterium]|nr:Flp pilus assembly protein CpaB [Peptococcaceae bacterium]
MRPKIILVLALVCGVAAALGIYLHLENLKEKYQKAGNFHTVVVAKEKISAGSTVTVNALTLKEIPSKYIHPEAADKIDEVQGKIALDNIYPGEQVISSNLAARDEIVSQLALAIKPGQRAVTVAINEVSGLAGLCLPGDRVDVAVTYDDKTSVIIQNALILAINQNLQKHDKTDTSQLRTATLAVTPEQAQELILASERGSIRLMLRSPVDSDFVDLHTVNMQHLGR